MHFSLVWSEANVIEVGVVFGTHTSCTLSSWAAHSRCPAWCAFNLFQTRGRMSCHHPSWVFGAIFQHQLVKSHHTCMACSMHLCFKVRTSCRLWITQLAILSLGLSSWHLSWLSLHFAMRFNICSTAVDVVGMHLHCECQALCAVCMPMSTHAVVRDTIQQLYRDCVHPHLHWNFLSGRAGRECRQIGCAVLSLLIQLLINPNNTQSHA